MSAQSDLIEKYSTIVYEYFAIMHASELVRSMDNHKHIVQLGLNAITHIYKLAFLSSKNVSTAVGHCQKGIYCFIEYIEQMNKLSSLHNLDCADVIMFIYDRSLSDIYGGRSSSGSSSVFTNILSFSQSHQAHGEELIRSKRTLDQISRVCSSLIWFQNNDLTLLDQMDIIDTHLSSYIGFASSMDANIDHAFLFLEVIQEKIVNITKEQYLEILGAFTKYIKRALKHNQLPVFENMRDACLYLGVLYSGQTLERIAEEEGWRKPTEDIVKWCFSYGNNNANK